METHGQRISRVKELDLELNQLEKIYDSLVQESRILRSIGIGLRRHHVRKNTYLYWRILDGEKRPYLTLSREEWPQILLLMSERQRENFFQMERERSQACFRFSLLNYEKHQLLGLIENEKRLKQLNKQL